MKPKNYLKAPELFQKISEKSGYVTPEQAIQVYHGLLRALTEELRQGKRVRLPELGDFYLQKRRNMTSYHFQSGQIMRKPEVVVVKFAACSNIGKYFNQLLT